MMEYTGKYWSMFSEVCDEKVNILEYKSAHKTKIPWCECSRCGKPITANLYVVQSEETDVEMFYLGPECIKKFR